MNQQEIKNEAATTIEQFQPQPFLISLTHAEVLSQTFNVPVEDVTMISLNCSGLNRGESEHDRGRLIVSPDKTGRSYRVALTVTNRTLSPFTHHNNKLWLGDGLVGLASEIEKDTCTDSYWRDGGRHLTLNSNSRSNCKGCEFCGTYSLEEDDQPLTAPGVLKARVDRFKREEQIDFRRVESIGVVTGCFPNERTLVNHLSEIRSVFGEAGFIGEIQYIGTQVRSEEAIKTLAEQGPFAYYLTVEAFERRQKLMKRTKASLDLESGRQLLYTAKKFGMDTTFLYIAGLDGLDTFEDELPKYQEVITRLPSIQTFQIYEPNQISLRNMNGNRPEYYLKMRQITENTFTDLRPDLCFNYRGLWYSEYANQPLRQPNL